LEQKSFSRFRKPVGNRFPVRVGRIT
jgi:hypothetical protein